MARKQSKTIIAVAVLADELMGWGSGKHYFPVILDKYRWTIKGKTYEFRTEYIHEEDILAGRLTASDYDVLLVPGGGVGDGQAILKSFLLSRKVRKWKKNIASFIIDGGGYIGICGGAALFTGLNTGKHPPLQTVLERAYHKSRVNIGSVKSFYPHLAIPLLYPFQYAHPENIGATAYVFSFAPGETTTGERIHTGGVPLDFSIDISHPVFSECSKDVLRMRWWGGPAFDISNHSDCSAKPIAWYPDHEFSLAKKTRINVWRYTGGIWGLFKAFFKANRFYKASNKSLWNFLLYIYFFAGDWEKTNHIINLKFAKKPAITTETYPNTNQARILLCSTHPEYMIWDDGQIEEMENQKMHCLAEGLHQWKNISLSKEKIPTALTSTWWLVRRMVAWAAKIPDDHLPPIIPEKDNKKIHDIISRNIIWDETVDHQIRNI